MLPNHPRRLAALSYLAARHRAAGRITKAMELEKRIDKAQTAYGKQGHSDVAFDAEQRGYERALGSHRFGESIVSKDFGDQKDYQPGSHVEFHPGMDIFAKGILGGKVTSKRKGTFYVAPARRTTKAPYYEPRKRVKTDHTWLRPWERGWEPRPDSSVRESCDGFSHSRNGDTVVITFNGEEVAEASVHGDEPEVAFYDEVPAENSPLFKGVLREAGRALGFKGEDGRLSESLAESQDRLASMLAQHARIHPAYRAAYAARMDTWVPASGGHETPFTARSGKKMLYVFNPKQGKHAYYDVHNDLLMSDEEAAAHMQHGKPQPRHAAMSPADKAHFARKFGKLPESATARPHRDIEKDLAGAYALARYYTADKAGSAKTKEAAINAKRIRSLQQELRRSSQSRLPESKKARCWKGYEPTPGKRPFSKGSCRKVDEGSMKHMMRAIYKSVAAAHAPEHDKAAAKRDADLAWNKADHYTKRSVARRDARRQRQDAEFAALHKAITSGERDLDGVPASRSSFVYGALRRLKEARYVGVPHGHGKREIFHSESEPTEHSHGDKYAYVVGPFRTAHGAMVMAHKHRELRPVNVDHAERLAKIAPPGYFSASNMKESHSLYEYRTPSQASRDARLRRIRRGHARLRRLHSLHGVHPRVRAALAQYFRTHESLDFNQQFNDVAAKAERESVAGKYAAKLRAMKARRGGR